MSTTRDPTRSGYDMLEIERMWEIFTIDKNCVLELRAISPFGRPPLCKIFKASEYASLDELKKAFVQEALRLNQQKRNVYIVMNPIRSDFSGNSACDADITCRRLLFVDIDRRKKANCPASEAELGIALTTAIHVRDYLATLGIVEPILVMSGNGYHIYYRLDDLPNTDEITRFIVGILRTLATMFDNDFVQIDTKVSNASRFTKVPGTIAYKGIASHERPYREAVIV
jgi:hypothetical protein